MARQPTDLRVRSKLPSKEAEALIGHVLTADAYDVLITQDCRVSSATGELLAVFRKKVYSEAELEAAYKILTTVRGETSNRTYAAGSGMVRVGKQTRALPVTSNILGSFEATTSRFPACRMTVWTADHPDQWGNLLPYFQHAAAAYKENAPEHYNRQMAQALKSHAEWVIPGTPYTTITVNNTYATSAHKDAGDYKDGLSMLTVIRKGDWMGGNFVLPEYRVAFAIDHGDLLMMNPHLIHCNDPLRYGDEVDLTKPRYGELERVSVVMYFRDGITTCGSDAEEFDRWRLAQSKLLA